MFARRAGLKRPPSSATRADIRWRDARISLTTTRTVITLMPPAANAAEMCVHAFGYAIHGWFDRAWHYDPGNSWCAARCLAVRSDDGSRRVGGLAGQA